MQNQELQEKLNKFVKAFELHSFRAEIDGDSVVGYIPWIDTVTRETGYDAMRVRTIEDLKEALGY